MGLQTTSSQSQLCQVKAFTLVCAWVDGGPGFALRAAGLNVSKEQGPVSLGSEVHKLSEIGTKSLHFSPQKS